MTVFSRQNREMAITKNKSIMEYALTYADKVMNDKSVLEHINHVRLYKKVFLPFELVGSSGRDETQAFQEDESMSQVKWTFYRHEVDKLNKTSFKIWRPFIVWLK